MNIKLKSTIIALVALLFSVSINAQQPTSGQAIDKVVALVGNMMVMESDMMGKIMILKQSDPTINEFDPEYRKIILDGIIDEKLVIAKAIEDSMVVSEAQVEQSWSQWLAGTLQRFGSEERLSQLYGMSLGEIKTKMKQEIKNSQLRQMAVSSKFGDMKVTRNEVDAFYAEYKDSMPEIPMSIDVYHIVRKVKVKENVKEDIEALALRVRDTILSGGDFGAFAMQYSEDIYSKEEGGELGWFEKSRLFPEFVSAANKLQVGEVSMPIETPLGIHLIQTVDKTEDKLNTSHILFKIGKTQKDAAEAMDYLKMLKDSVTNYNADFELLAKLHSEDIETKGFGGHLGLLPIAEFPSNIQMLLNNIENGGVSDPLLFERDAYHIIFKKATIDAHKANMKTDYRIVENMSLMNKKSKAVEEWLVELRKELYWEYAK